MTAVLPMLRLPQVLTHDEVVPTLRMFKEKLAQTKAENSPTALMIDGSDLQKFDSSVLAVLLDCRRMAQAQGRDFQVQNLPSKLIALAKLYGLETFLTNAEVEMAD